MRDSCPLPLPGPLLFNENKNAIRCDTVQSMLQDCIGSNNIGTVDPTEAPNNWGMNAGGYIDDWGRPWGTGSQGPPWS